MGNAERESDPHFTNFERFIDEVLTIHRDGKKLRIVMVALNDETDEFNMVTTTHHSEPMCAHTILGILSQTVFMLQHDLCYGCEGDEGGGLEKDKPRDAKEETQRSGKRTVDPPRLEAR